MLVGAKVLGLQELGWSDPGFCGQNIESEGVTRKILERKDLGSEFWIECIGSSLRFFWVTVKVVRHTDHIERLWKAVEKWGGLASF